MPGENKKPAIGRSEVSFLFAIVLGLAVGIMIKKLIKIKRLFSTAGQAGIYWSSASCWY